MMTSKRLLAVAVSAALYAPLSAFATNGMNLEGYGPIATGMGGASMAYDNGTAAMMNNPATLGLMASGNRLDVALGGLHPDIDTSFGPMNWSSEATAFYMPAVGWAKKSGALTFGVGMFAQGGMGTEYKGASPGGAMSAGVAVDTANQWSAGFTSMGGTLDATDVYAAAGALQSADEYSEVGVGRLLFPVAFNVSDKLTVGGSLDFVWAGMDIQMMMPGNVMMDMINSGLISGTMVDGMMDPANFHPMALDAMAGNPPTPVEAVGMAGLNGGYFDFRNGSDFTQETFGSGFAGKLGFTYKATNKMTVGGTYHSKTSLSDLEGDATVVMSVDTLDTSTLFTTNSGTLTEDQMNITGKIKVKNFEWPETYGLGFAYQENERLMVTVDVKRIRWADVMKEFTMVFTAADGSVMTAVLPQNWKDQNVVQAGISYKATDATTVRFGASLSNNPIPLSTVHYLFPATVRNHYTVGFGHAIDKAQSVDFSVSLAEDNTVPMGDSGATISHSQTNWQVMYSNRF